MSSPRVLRDVPACLILCAGQQLAWVVLKFGGTSVSTAANWHNIATGAQGATRRRPAARGRSLRPLRHHRSTRIAAGGGPDGNSRARSGADRRRDTGRSRKLGRCAESRNSTRFMQELRQLAAELAQRRDIDDEIRARVMADGRAARHLPGLRIFERAGDRDGLGRRPLGAACRRAPECLAKGQPVVRNLRLHARCRTAGGVAGLDQVVITQGFIAANAAGADRAFGPRRLGHLRRVLRRQARARHVSRSGPTCPVCSAPIRGPFRPRGCCASCTTMKRRKSPATAPRFCIRAAYCRCGSIRFPCMCMRPRRLASKARWYRPNVADSAAQVKAIAIRKGITLVSMESPGMWHQVGFLADAFQIFKQHGLSVDLVSTSETNVTVSLDPSANTLDGAVLERLTRSLSELCRVEILGPCASLSLLGQNIRGILHEMGSAFELFQDQKIYLVTQAANDLNFTFVIDESQGDRSGAAAARATHSEHRIGSGARAHLVAAVRRQECRRRACFELVGAAAEAQRSARYRDARVGRLCLRRADARCRHCRGAGASGRSSAGPMP